MMKRELPVKEWFVIYRENVPLGIARGEKKSYAAMIIFRGTKRRGYRTLLEALKGLERGADYNGDESHPLF